eukprot:CAMPEP_0114615806 /NCGR_PEP_ID=MMETSP0168-20121206/6362_1 /TAXON_ID=95228 ORGANISM="Vannella sp., Strain DIVA3 517/6/12" /NCGR_SAMPLE_ID=MMETSP0168 /ASSEMBLY_ACC=CAM_ASM_000044 /LENGTH=121 /DNA_ID=CAMNT_0001826903 /DNA_START=81 /DNA_END=443 /DNA_ORIENTATION=+
MTFAHSIVSDVPKAFCSSSSDAFSAIDWSVKMVSSVRRWLTAPLQPAFLQGSVCSVSAITSNWLSPSLYTTSWNAMASSGAVAAVAVRLRTGGLPKVLRGLRLMNASGPECSLPLKRRRAP